MAKIRNGRNGTTHTEIILIRSRIFINVVYAMEQCIVAMAWSPGSCPCWPGPASAIHCVSLCMDELQWILILFHNFILMDTWFVDVHGV